MAKFTPSGWQRPSSKTSPSLAQHNFVLPTSKTMAKIEAKKMVDATKSSRGTATDISNRAMMASMRGATGTQRTAANTQMVLPKVRQPLASLMDKGIPYNTHDPKELQELRRWCNSPSAPVWMADYSFKPMGDIEVGDQVIGWETEEWRWEGSSVRRDGAPTTRKRRTLVPTTVLAINRRVAPEVVRIHFASGRTVECTPDHEWLRYYVPNSEGLIQRGPEKSSTKTYDSDYAPLSVGSVARHVVDPTMPLEDYEKMAAAHYLAGMLDGDGTWRGKSFRIYQSTKNVEVVNKIDWAFKVLDLNHSRRISQWSEGQGRKGKLDMVVWELSSGERGKGSEKNRKQLVDFFNWTHPAKITRSRMNQAMLTSNFGQPDTVVSIESLGPGEVISMQTTTGNYTAWGFASKNCRLFYATHPLVPLLVDIYSKFPVMGLEFVSKDPEVERFYTQMFMDDLNYEEFLPDGLLREYFMVGEVTALAHFNEELGVWSSEEILNPDMIRVSKSLFVEQERVQLAVKELVDSLRDGPNGMGGNEESPSERYERTWEYRQLTEHYPEIIQAAAQDDGLDISDALVSRLVNKAAWWDLRGTPHLLRSFRTLMLEESLNAAQDAVCDRLYAPMVLATLGIENMGDGEPWIPDQGELEDFRDDIQAALAGDFKLLVHNFGVQVTSVFGRESVPRFDTDYDRVDAQLMQAWGIGQGLIMGGTGSGGTYAGTAINREVCEQLMSSAQKKVIRHIRKRMEIVSEAQEFYDFELKGGQREVIYEEVIEEDPDTGEQYTVRVPKLIDVEIKFATLNLRDEATERSFVSQLKQLGVPISDKTLAINIPFEFDQELERQAQETIDKGMAQAEAMHVLQELCDELEYPYPAELNQHLQGTLQTRAMLAQTDMAEAQNKQMDAQIAQASPAGMMGLLPGTTMQPLAGSGAVGAPGDPNAGASPGEGQVPVSDATPGAGAPMAAPSAGGMAGVPSDPSALAYGQMTATMHGPKAHGPSMFPPGGEVEKPMNTDLSTDFSTIPQRPPESDEQRGSMPKQLGRRRLANTTLPGKGREDEFEFAALHSERKKTFGKLRQINLGPSSVRKTREEKIAASNPTVYDLVHSREFWAILHAQAYESQIQADWPEIQAGGAPGSAKLLDELLEQYEDITGIRPRG